MNNQLTQERLKELLDYDPLTGVFVWKVQASNNVKIGDIAGCNHSEGYRAITIAGKIYKAHRLAWLYVYGYLPEPQIDHKDQVRHHNFIENLREVSQSCNLRNTGNYQHNTSGVKGVCWHKRVKKWRACLRVNDKIKHLGYYSDFANAACARLAGEQACNWSNCDSNSPAFQYVKNNIQI